MNKTIRSKGRKSSDIITENGVNNGLANEIETLSVESEINSCTKDAVLASAYDKNNSKPEHKPKAMGNADHKNAKDVVMLGEDLFKLLSKEFNENEGWSKSTKAFDTGKGCIIQVTTQQLNADGTYALAEALTFVPGVKLNTSYNADGEVSGRTIKSSN